MRTAFPQYFQEAERRLNSELWHACAGPLVSLPSVGSLVVYFPQGHSEQIAALTKEGVDAHIPNYPNLPPQLFCQLHNITLQADGETDEVYAQMTLQPLNPHEQKESYLASNLSTPGRQPINYFCKTLTASDTSTHGGFSIPRRAAEKVFPRLDFSQQPPVQELVAKDLHDNEWKFRHIYRGQPKRHLLTTGWSVFVNAKRLVSGDSVVFVRNEKGQLLLGIRRANRTHPVMASSVLSSDTMHIGVLAAAAHAASTNCRFSIFYNPRASPSEFVVPITKYEKSVRRMQVSVGMRFEMLFETEESTVRRHIGTIIGIGDFDPVHWPNSQWRSIKVGWDVSAVGERQQRVSMWEIEPLTTFLMYPPPYPLELKRPWSQIQGISSLYGNDGNIRMPFVSIKRDSGEQNLQTLSFQGMGMDPWMHILDRYESSVSGMQLDIYQGMAEAALQETRNVVDPCKQLKFQQQPPNQLQQQELNLQQQQPVNHLMQQRLQKQASQHRLMQEQLQKSFNEQQQPSFHQQDQQTPFQQHHHQQQTFQVSDVAGSLPQFPLSKSQSSISLHSVCSQPVVVNTSANPASQTTSSSKSSFHCIFGFLTSERGSQYLNLATPSQPVVQQPAENLTWPCVPQGQQLPTSWFSLNRILNDPVPCLPAGQVEVPLSSGSQSVLPRLEPADQSNIPTQLCHFTLADCFSEQERERSDSQCNLLFGVNIDIPSLVSPDTVPNSRNVGNGAYVASSLSDLLNVSPCASGSGFALNSDIGTSGSKGESGFLQHSANFTKMTRTFTKVYKLGSVGRSLDVTRFNGYPELRAELDHMFELEGQLKDPQRSGWQLVFVDKEKDVLLLGDGPWEEFVNNVQFIKILSPPEVLQMNREGIKLLSSIPSQRQTSTCSEDCVPRHDFRNRYSVITSAGPLES